MFGVATRITNGRGRPDDRGFLEQYSQNLAQIDAASPAHGAAVRNALQAGRKARASGASAMLG
ncbi:MAG TPA: hypothetical protein VFH61_08370 [Thermoleophilia bacterium]|nr:hypothetical protein [Thermoleophilia bacterium]